MYQSLTIVGNVGRDPEMKFTPSGQAVCSFSVATNRKYTTGSGEKVDETTWFRVTTWGKTAEICNQYVHKGSKVLVEGRLTPDKSTGGPRAYAKKDGTPAATYEITAGTVRFLSSNDGGNGQHTETPFDAPVAEDDIPF